MRQVRIVQIPGAKRAPANGAKTMIKRVDGKVYRIIGNVVEVRYTRAPSVLRDGFRAWRAVPQNGTTYRKVIAA